MNGVYENPLCTRYAGEEMKKIFSADNKFSTWRKLWVALAESEKELGLDITDSQIAQMKEHIYDIDYDRAAEYESRFRHDVMAHVHTYGEACPLAKPVIHLGATSCYVGDNTDIILMKEAMLRIKTLLVSTIAVIGDFAEKYKDVPTLAFTHFQAAQPTTVGKRACLWAQDLIMDLEHLDFVLDSLKLLGCKGTTGTGASFLELFEGDGEKVKKLEKLIAKKMGFEACVSVSGQTYSRKTDYFVMSVLSGIAQSASKFANDIRLLSHLKEFDEPFESGQIGSSAMAYKRNPMRSERICALARYVMTDSLNPAITAATQWLERSLDDSANKRISIPEGFLATDGILNLYMNIISGGTIYPYVTRKHLNEELPFMATENIIMYCTRKGGDRQELHEAVREISVEVTKRIKLEGCDNDLLERILNDKRFDLTEHELNKIMDINNFVGLAPQQAEEFIENNIKPVLKKNSDFLGAEAQINV
ncbi:MAG: adenylosuccinate lyase [Candidatus Fimisoma sp.]|nr:adenylosuccinate lyase [Bacillota bacterium]MDY4747778.1 adenylosuccinate lyase [Candidatus Fimisoma sp.]